MNQPDSAAGIGHNKPPSDEKQMVEDLKSKHKAILDEFASVMRSADDVPTEVENDEDSGKVNDFMKELQNLSKQIETTRTGEVAPYLTGQRVVNNFFKKMGEELDKMRSKFDTANKRYMTNKAKREQAERDEAARKAREAAAEKLRIAQEAEAKAKKEKEAAEAEAKRIADEAAQALKDKEAELERIKNEGAADKEVIKEKETELKKATTEITEKVAETTREIRRTARQASRGFRRALDEAVTEDQLAARTERQATETLSKLSKTRGDVGTGAVSTEWIATINDTAKLDLELLRPFIPVDALKQAAQAYVRTLPKPVQGQPLKGALITEELKTNYR